MAYTDEALTRLFTPYWQLGLYLSGQDPMTNLATAEVTGGLYSRYNLTAWGTPTDANPAVMAYSTDIGIGGLPNCTLGGYFVIAQGATTPLFSVAFTSPVAVTYGDMVTIAGADVVITLGIA